MTIAKTYWCENVLIDEAWKQSVVIECNSAGDISAIRSDVDSQTLDNAVVKFHGSSLPGMTNLHSHAHQRAMSGLGEKAQGGDSFWTWRTAMYQFLTRIQPDQLYWIARMVYTEMLQAGYTHVGEFQYLHHDVHGERFANPAEMTLQCLRAAQDVGIGFTALPVLYRYGGFGSEASNQGQKRFINNATGFLEIVEKIESALGRNDRVGIAPHSLRAIDASLLQEVLDATPTDRKIHIHIAEQVKEVKDCIAFSNLRPVEWLYQHFSPDEHWCLIHATHMNGSETKMVAESNSIAGLCPTTEANLGDGLFNAASFFALDGKWGIGSDSHISISPVEELRWLEYGIRLNTLERNVLGKKAPDFAGDEGAHHDHIGFSLYHQAAKGGATACGVNIGEIKVGNRADLVVVDHNHPRLFSRIDHYLLDSYIFSGNENMIKDVVVGGNHVVQSGQQDQIGLTHDNYRQTIKHLMQ